MMAKLLKFVFGKRAGPSSVYQKLKTRKEEALEEEGNCFDKLSDDFILSNILDKIPDAICLCKCTLVSKRFSSLVRKVSMISFTLPPPRKRSLAQRILDRTHKYSLTYLSRDRGFHLLRHLCDVKLLHQMTFSFLNKFEALKSVTIGYDFSRREKIDGLLKWRSDSQTDSFVLMCVDNQNVAAAMREFGWILREIDWTLFLIGVVASFWPKELKNVVFIDSEKRGMLDYDEKALVYIRRRWWNTIRQRQFSLTSWYQPKLELPSELVMEDVVLLIFKGDAMVDDALIAEKIGEGEDIFISEAASEMVKKEAYFQTVEMSEFSRFTASRFLFKYFTFVINVKYILNPKQQP